MKSEFKIIVKSKYFYCFLIELLFISILSPCLFNCFLSKEEDLFNLLNEFGIHHYTIFIILISIVWTFFVFCLLKTCNKIDLLIKEFRNYGK